MKTVSHEQLEVGQIVVMTKAPHTSPGLVDRLFKVMAIDAPYAVLRTGAGAAATSHMINASEAQFALPDNETIAAMMPEFILDAEYIED